MKTHHNPLLFTIATVLLLSGPIHADDPLPEPPQNSLGVEKGGGQPGPHAFSIHDIDQDGFLSRDEYQLFEDRRNTTERPMRRFLPPLRFEEIDNDGDGYITEEEMTSALNQRLRKHRRYRSHGGRR